jgi:ABC-type maltose transport system permease subunit
MTMAFLCVVAVVGFFTGWERLVLGKQLLKNGAYVIVAVEHCQVIVF